MEFLILGGILVVIAATVWAAATIFFGDFMEHYIDGVDDDMDEVLGLDAPIIWPETSVIRPDTSSTTVAEPYRRECENEAQTFWDVASIDVKGVSSDSGWDDSGGTVVEASDGCSVVDSGGSCGGVE